LIAAHNGKPPWSSKAFVLTVCKVEPHDVVSGGIVRDKFRDEHTRELIKQVLIILKVEMDVYMVEVIAESHY